MNEKDGKDGEDGKCRSGGKKYYDGRIGWEEREKLLLFRNFLVIYLHNLGLC
jgi:hypothetical protein